MSLFNELLTSNEVATFKHQAAQGDCVITRKEKLDPDLNWTRVESEYDDKAVIAHSETGHHHSIPKSNVMVFMVDGNPLILGLHVQQKTRIVHEKPDAATRHTAIELEPGYYEVRRQREMNLELRDKYRMVAD